eukprot:3844194-Rhodomonas_salina.3
MTNTQLSNSALRKKACDKAVEGGLTSCRCHECACGTPHDSVRSGQTRDNAVCCALTAEGGALTACLFLPETSTQNAQTISQKSSPRGQYSRSKAYGGRNSRTVERRSSRGNRDWRARDHNKEQKRALTYWLSIVAKPPKSVEISERSQSREVHGTSKPAGPGKLTRCWSRE